MSAEPNLQPASTGNLFLDALAPESVARLTPKLERLALSVGQPIADQGQPIEHVIFPVHSVISTVANLRDGASIEVMVTGREGFFGLALALGDDTNTHESMVQIADSAFKMRSADFVACLREDSALNKQLLRYAQATLMTLGQFAACNRHHPVNERCARWLLMAHDRVLGDELLLTHEYLATMLGVRRPGVSLAAAALDEAGLIEYHRGRILVRNRRGLEAAACECYAIVNDEFDRLLGYDVRKRPTSSGPRNS